MSELMSPASADVPHESEDLFFAALVRGYVKDNRRFLRREWLAEELEGKLRELGKRFVLLTAEPGAGKSAFVAQLAHDHPEWLCYFIRRDQRTPLSDVSARSVLFRIGYQLVARQPELFSKELHVSVEQQIGTVSEGGEAIGADVKQLIVSPFFDEKVLRVKQFVQENQGTVIGLRVEELVIEERLLATTDLLHLALVAPARGLQRIDPKRQIVILIDALDEIRYHQTSENILAWLTNCPELPDNIRFVLTSRPPDDALKRFCEKQAPHLSKLPIVEDDPHVKEDVKRFVRGLIGEPTLKKALQEIESGAEDFAEKAVQKAHGNLGYLDALARGIDRAIAETQAKHEATQVRGRRTLDALLSLKELPADLDGLYAFFLHQIKGAVSRERIELQDLETGETYDKLVWPTVYHRILGVLAVAMEPLDLELIEQLGGIRAERIWVLQALDRLMQFLDVVNGRYRLYHATVPEFLTAEKTRTDRENADLYQDAKQRHRQIADHYWTHDGDWSKCGNYGLAHLAGHLNQAGQFDRLHELISQDWMKARVAGNDYTYDSFINDVEIAWQHAHESALIEINAGATSIRLADCVRYALIETSINSLASKYLPALINRAVETGLWSSTRALSFASRIVSPFARFDMYLPLLKMSSPSLTVEQRSTAITGALAAIRAMKLDVERAGMVRDLRAIQPELGRAKSIAQIAPHLKRQEKETLLQEVLTTIFELEESDRVEALIALAPELSGKLVEEAFENVRRIKNSGYRAAAIAALGPRLQSELVTEALKMAHTIKDTVHRAKAITALATHLDEKEREKELRTTLRSSNRMKDESARAQLLTVIAPAISAEPLRDALEAARNIKNQYNRTQALAALAPRLSGEMLIRVSELARGLDDNDYRARVLVTIVPQLNGPDKLSVVKETFALWTTIKDQALGSAVEVFDALIPHLSDELVVKALGIACNISYDPNRAKALASLAPRLGASLITEALTAARQMKDGSCLAHALAALAQESAGNEQQSLMKEALAAVKTIQTENGRAYMLSILAPKLSKEILGEVLAEVVAIRDIQESLKALESLTPHLKGNVKGLIVRERVRMARVFKDGRLVVQALADLLLLVPEEEKQEVVREASRYWVYTIPDHAERLKAIIALAPRLSGQEKDRLIAEGVNQLTWMDDNDAAIASAIVDLAPRLSGQLLAKAVEKVPTLGDYSAATALTALAPWLSDKLLQDAIGMARQIENQVYRAQAFAFLASQSGQVKEQAIVQEALEFLRAVNNDWRLAPAVAALAPRVCESDRAELLNNALATIRAVHDSKNRARALLSLAQCLPDEENKVVVKEALESLSELEPGTDRIRLLAKLVTGTNCPKPGLTNFNHSIVEHLRNELRAGHRRSVLYFLGDKELFPFQIFDKKTLNSIARNIVEICNEWRWGESQLGV